MQQIGINVITLRSDWRRRLSNALTYLVLNDPRWMIWVNEEIDPEAMTLPEMARMVEARARAFLLKRYGYFGHACIGDLIFRDWPFTDSGSISPG
jgi:hypothetical protein